MQSDLFYRKELEESFKKLKFLKHIPFTPDNLCEILIMEEIDSNKINLFIRGTPDNIKSISNKK